MLIVPFALRWGKGNKMKRAPLIGHMNNRVWNTLLSCFFVCYSFIHACWCVYVWQYMVSIGNLIWSFYCFNTYCIYEFELTKEKADLEISILCVELCFFMAIDLSYSNIQAHRQCYAEHCELYNLYKLNM